MHTVVKYGTTMSHEYSGILEQDRDLDRDHDRIINRSLDRLELSDISVRSAYKSS